MTNTRRSLASAQGHGRKPTSFASHSADSSSEAAAQSRTSFASRAPALALTPAKAPKHNALGLVASDEALPPSLPSPSPQGFSFLASGPAAAVKVATALRTPPPAPPQHPAPHPPPRLQK